MAAATSALASNREIVEVLNFVGAEEKFIAKQFETHFLKVGIRAGIFGAGLATLGFLSIPYIAELMGTLQLRPPRSGDSLELAPSISEATSFF